MYVRMGGKPGRWKMLDWKMTDETTGLKNNRRTGDKAFYIAATAEVATERKCTCKDVYSVHKK